MLRWLVRSKDQPSRLHCIYQDGFKTTEEFPCHRMAFLVSYFTEDTLTSILGLCVGVFTNQLEHFRVLVSLKRELPLLIREHIRSVKYENGRIQPFSGQCLLLGGLRDSWDGLDTRQNQPKNILTP